MRSRKQNCEASLHELATASPVEDTARVEAEGMNVLIPQGEQVPEAPQIGSMRYGGMAGTDLLLVCREASDTPRMLDHPIKWHIDDSLLA